MPLDLTPDNSSKNLAGFGMITIAVFALAALVWLRVGLPQSVCSAPPKALFAVLLDSTSRLSEAQRLDLGNRLRSIVTEMPPGARLQFWKVAPTGDRVPMALADPACKPDPNPDKWTRNVKRAESEARRFKEQIEKQIDAALTAQEHPESPILEALQAVWLRFLGSDQYPPDVERHLIIASDLAQNTPAISFYRELPTRDALQENKRYQSLRVPLGQTDVTLLYMRHEDRIEAGRLIELWEWIFSSMGASLNKVERITG